MPDPIETPWEGRFLTVKVEGKWEYVSRRAASTPR